MTTPPAAPTDPIAIVRTRGYVVILVFAAILGVPISAAAYGFLGLISHLQTWVFTDPPERSDSTRNRRGGRFFRSSWPVILYAEATDKRTSDVLFSGQDQLRVLIQNNATYTVGELLMLIAYKGLAYSAALSSFRGGPVFPATHIGATGGIRSAQRSRPMAVA
jgi:hypothetical protein